MTMYTDPHDCAHRSRHVEGNPVLPITRIHDNKDDVAVSSRSGYVAVVVGDVDGEKKLAAAINPFSNLDARAARYVRKARKGCSCATLLAAGAANTPKDRAGNACDGA